ncbi:hypothetical protein Plhal710r2_c005g0024041 [Plasmopara halstedii]
MYVQHCKRLHKIMLPVFHDLQFQLAFRLLPVRSRFWFLEALHPDIRVCIRDGCSAIESEQHLFFDCLLASQLWSEVSYSLLLSSLRGQRGLTLRWTRVANTR